MLSIAQFSDAKRGRRKFVRGVKFSPAITAKYYVHLRKMLEWIQAEFKRTVVDGLSTQEMTRKIKNEIRDESPNERYKKRLALFNKRLRGKFPRERIEKMVRQSLKDASTYSQRKMLKEFKDFGLDLTKGENVVQKYSSYTATAVEENIMLVKNLMDEQAKRLKSVVLRGMREGIPTTRLAGDLQKSLGIAKRRAVLIARTETHKITQQLADYRAEEVGITRGVWDAVMDNRTSAQHARFDGHEFDLKKGLWDPRTRSWNWPGRRPNCRCHTRYLIPGFKD